MKKSKRIFALISAILLILLYLSTLIFALIDSPLTNDLLIVSVAATIILPVLLYGLILFGKLNKDPHDED